MGGKRVGHPDFTHEKWCVLTTFHPKIPKQIGMSKAERWREGSNLFLNLSLSALVMQVESFWNDFIMAAQKSRGDWPSLRKRSQAMADAWDLSEAVRWNAIERTKIRYFLGSMSIYELETSKFQDFQHL